MNDNIDNHEQNVSNDHIGNITKIENLPVPLNVTDPDATALQLAATEHGQVVIPPGFGRHTYAGNGLVDPPEPMQPMTQDSIPLALRSAPEIPLSSTFDPTGMNLPEDTGVLFEEEQEEKDEDFTPVFIDTNPNEVVEVPQPVKSNVYILHHGDCDGYAAGAIAYNSMFDTKRKFHTLPVNYGQPFPDIALNKDDEVYILDFSYTRAILDNVASRVGKLLVLDHHETAKDELAGAPYAHFDMTKSGVLLAWEYFVPEYPASEAVALLDAYDLWRKNDPVHSWEDVVAFHLACMSHLEDFAFWTALMNGYYIDAKLLVTGQQMYQELRTLYAEVKGAVSTEVRVIHGKRFGFFFADEAISLLCDAMYSEKSLKLDAVICATARDSGVWSLSLRAPSHTAFCVHEIAKALGGGGHKKAAGVKLVSDLAPADLVDDLSLRLNALNF